ncbi:MAG: hypothetical protein GY811_26460 [Myxococcales bacterium]|nr:hypothetical protein [Myxococcales bacterium]
MKILQIATLCLTSSLLAFGCAPEEPAPQTRCSDGRCDSKKTTYVADFDKLNTLFPSSWPMTKIEDAFTVRVELGEASFDSPTHLFDAPVTLIPYSDQDNVKDAAGNLMERRDSELAKYFPVGAVGFAVKHHRPQYRDLKLNSGGPEMKEHFKLQDTHIEIVVGVERDGQPGVITLNNPQSYEDGLFGTKDYPMFFVRPSYPDYLTSEQQVAFGNNIRTMAAAFNAVSNFPGDYNGGDPLGARNPDAVLEHSAMMVRAIAGDSTAVAFFEDPNNLIYCAELAHVSSSAGLIAPLNARTFVPLVGEDTWNKFAAAVAAHNAGEETAFLTMNDNKRVALVGLTLAPEGLSAAHTYAPDGLREADAAKLAFQPMTMSDIVEEFLRTHIPRETFGESLGGAQAAILTVMKPGLFETMAIDKLAENDPIRMAVDALFGQIVAVLAKDHGSYENFRAAIAPYLAQAQQITGPRDGSGAGLFVPPSLLHVIAQDKHPGGLLGLDYVGHGLHTSLVMPEQSEPTEPDPTEPAPTESDPNSCEERCGDEYSNTNSCQCDAGCSEYGDCCSDYENVCSL